MKNLSGFPDRVYFARWYWRSSRRDPEHSADVFARDVLNQFGEEYCVYPSVSKEDANQIVCGHNNEIRGA